MSRMARPCGPLFRGGRAPTDTLAAADADVAARGQASSMCKAGATEKKQGRKKKKKKKGRDTRGAHLCSVSDRGVVVVADIVTILLALTLAQPVGQLLGERRRKRLDFPALKPQIRT